jgi:uncharacterized coiled-coil protein SlyX
MAGIEFIVAGLGIVGSLVITLLSFMINKLNKTIEKLEQKVDEMNKFISAQTVINKQTEKLAYIIEKLENRQQDYNTALKQLQYEHQQHHKG